MRTRPLIPLLAALAVLLVPASAPAAEIGLNVNGGAAAANPDNWSTLGDTGAKWARHFVTFTGSDTPDGGYDAIVEEEERRGIKTLFVVTALGGMRPDTGAYARYVGRLAARYRGRVEAYEIWNEADEQAFWPGAPDVAGYVDLLKASHAAIKGADPQAKVVFSPLTGNNYGFVEQAYAHGAKGHFDVMAVHTDTACLIDSPTKYYREGDRVARFVFLGYREVRQSMLNNGDDKPIWMTEFGWSVTTRTCDRGAWAGQKQAGVTEAQQAQFLREAYHCIQEDPYLEVAMWFNSRDLHGDDSELDSYGLRRADGSHRPAYDAFKDVARGHDTITGACGDFGGPSVRIISPASGFIFGDRDPLLIKADSSDPDVLRMTFAVKGRDQEIRNFTNGGLPLSFSSGVPSIDWQGAKELGYGRHTIVVTAIDSSGNAGSASVDVEKVNPATMRARPATFTGLRLTGRGRRRTLSGRLSSALPFAIPGKVVVRWETRRRGRWKKLHGAARNASKPFRFTQRLRSSGRWRVRVAYRGKRPFKRTRSCWVSFRTSSSKVRSRCATGLRAPGGRVR